MPLSEYRKKRNFGKTSEPAPRKGHRDGVLHFVVQKHNASHLHYDFRLENKGVLKSWAVPKGVPDDPSEKRLAIEVEDHPIEYQHFEGTIPKGNYGAGTVKIWDKGEYYIDRDLDRKTNEKKIEEELHKGHLKFFLKGKKYRGPYSLIKLHKAIGKQNQWLLLKKASSDGNGHAKPDSKMPDVINPMLATLVAEPFDRKGWIFEVKWDGYRILANIKDHQVRLYTRNNNTYTEKFPEIASELKDYKDAILDGEVVVVNEKGVSQFQLLQNFMRHHEGRLLYYVFDILYLDGQDLHQLPLSKRKEILKTLIHSKGIVRLSDYVTDKGKAFYKAAKKNGLEGIVAKNFQSTYQYGHRGMDWLKIKAIQEQEAIICGFTAPRGSRKFFGALILGLYKGKKLEYVGHTGGGFDYELLKDLHGRLKPLMTDQCPFQVAPKTNAPVTWVKPQLLCEVKFQEWTDDGSMRQPIFLGLRQDKKPKETYQEIPVAPKDVLPEQVKVKTKAILTNLEKIYWPDEGYTKGDMINYYQSIAAYILPYLKGRPQSLHRQPNGLNDSGFFQKDINFKPPAWIEIFELTSESKSQKVHHLVCRTKDDLAYMNNLGCIEINPWLSTVEDPHHPDFLVLDFDPDGIDFSKVIDTVLVARDILAKIKCPAFCKTSGSRGMHIYVPLKRKYTFEQTKDFSQMICMAIHQEMPKFTSLERKPQSRRGLIYLDYLQNHFTSTMAAPYSLRPRPGATVSTPLEWKEVHHGLVIQDFNIRTIPARLKKNGDLWKGISAKGIDMKKSLKILEAFLGS
jgi:bifunctional non-homologous end joining protein LigD